jgi:hypothetical protein
MYIYICNKNLTNLPWYAPLRYLFTWMKIYIYFKTSTIHAYIQAFIHAYTHRGTYMHAYTYLDIYMYICIDRYMDILINRYIHTYI